ncbi:MAG: hypothetical protein BWY50_00802 [Spirochaetes bacterium ADurb.Bin315]|jgi:hypothetical protein|nr:MAG: hypothetical protein BWY50_00802 [Spirochaetes bacterium ADurb.Bin315]
MHEVTASAQTEIHDEDASCFMKTGWRIFSLYHATGMHEIVTIVNDVQT